MPRRTSVTTELSRLVQKLNVERRQHVAAIADIDRTFAQFGIGESKPGHKAARPAKASKTSRKRRKRRSFTTTGEASVLAFVKKHGKPTTSDINKHWKAEGRGGTANNTLTKLVQAKKIKRVNDKSVRGSRYNAV